LTQAGSASSDRWQSLPRPPIVAGLMLAWLCCGCDRTEAIRHYRVPKEVAAGKSVPGGPETASPAVSPAPSSAAPPVAAAAPAAAQRMLAAIVLRPDRAWFFKAVGPDAQVAEHADAFRSLLRSVRFVDETPQWTLPEGWRQKAGSGMRFATLEFGAADQPLELTVIPLGVPPGEPSTYILSNVNRWREQLQLPRIAVEDLDKQTEQIELDGATATAVDLRGSAGE